MENILVDTSVWINYSNRYFNKQTDLLEEYLNFHPFHIWCCPPIIQEFLMGVKTDKEFEFYNLHFSRFIIPEIEWTKVSFSAAKLYFDLKKKGITVRKSNDCLIAQIAIENKALLVHNDSDFELIASASDLKTFC